MKEKLWKAVLAGSLFLVLLVAIYFVHVRYGHVKVVFYAAIADAVVATVLVAVVLFVLKTFGVFTVFEKLQLVVICALVGYALAISVPTVIDRSLSFYILEKLDQRGGGIRQDALAKVFVDEYMNEYRLVDVRLTEQLQSGTIRIDHGCVRLTKKGERIVGASTWFRHNMLPRQRYLMGKYTDALTDPFRHSRRAGDYLCR